MGGWVGMFVWVGGAVCECVCVRGGGGLVRVCVYVYVVVCGGGGVTGKISVLSGCTWPLEEFKFKGILAFRIFSMVCKQPLS